LLDFPFRDHDLCYEGLLAYLAGYFFMIMVLAAHEVGRAPLVSGSSGSIRTKR
jgi:hypothetical protein